MDINNKIESMWLTEGKTNKKLLNAGDMKDHSAVAALIKNDKNEILVQYHNKYNMVTLPVGKVDEGEDLEDTLKREMVEETNLNIKEMNHLFAFTKIYDRDKIRVAVVCHLYEVIQYSGNMKNAEPEKHKWMKFLPIDEILKYKPSDRSDVLNEYLKFIQIGESLEEEIEASLIGLYENTLEEIDYSDIQYDDYVLNEYYFGTNKELLRCEELIDSMKLRVAKNKVHALFGSKEIIEMEKLFAKIFNVESVTFETLTAYDYADAHTMPLGMMLSMGNDDLEVVRTEAGMKFKEAKGKHMVISFNNYALDILTARELLSFLIHEVGHNFHISPIATLSYKLRILVGIISMIMLMLIGGLPIGLAIASVIYLFTNVTTTGREFSNFLKNRTINNETSLKINNFLSSTLSVVMSTFNTLGNIISRVFILPNFMRFIINRLLSAPMDIISTYVLQGYKSEKFSDNFASAYGYGAELSSALAKLHSGNCMTVADSVIAKIPIVNVVNNITMNMVYFVVSLTEEHPSESQRIVEQIKFYKHELKKNNYPPSLKKELEENLQACLDIWDKINDPKYLLKNNNWIKALFMKIFGKGNIDKPYDAKEIFQPSTNYDYEEMK